MAMVALWASNVDSRSPPSPGARGQAKRHAAADESWSGRGGRRRGWVPGSKIPPYHYPSDRREVRADGDEQPRLQYMEGADTVVSARRVRPPADLRQDRRDQPQQRQQRQQQPRRRAGGAAGAAGGGQRRRAEGRKLRHQAQPRSWAPAAAAAGSAAPNVTLLRTVQRGSAVVPRGPGPVTLPVHPDPAQTQRVVVHAAVPPPANIVDLAPPVPVRPEPAAAAAAPAADSGVLATCPDGTPLDVIAGPQAGDPVPGGPHPVVGRLVLGGARAQGQGQGHPGHPTLCRLTYTVIVRRCGAPPPLVTAAGGQRSPRCTAGTAWGSRCHYRCPRRDLQLRGNTWLQCGDDLRWAGRPPVCSERPGPSTPSARREPPRRSCSVPTLPEHGVVSCRARDPEDAKRRQDDDDEDSNDAQRLAEGSECTVSCRPPHQLQLGQDLQQQQQQQGLVHGHQDLPRGAQGAVTRCLAGRWNVSSWHCVRGESPGPDADLDGDIPSVLADAGAGAPDWDWRDNAVTDPCSPNPCQAGGTCLRGPPESKKALCQCRPGTEGERCERALCRGTCLHAGRCVLLDGRPSCFCRRGYAGSRCQAPVRTVRYPASSSTPSTAAPVAATERQDTPNG
ncbi:Cadherin-related tumor suppressor [Frankliniella fusca]|uniref:Cadherin-related tumor suppressor n=1 Tax=Frankliniella fusca TaxID=407009 RepID=A0AAE1HUA5_9NEOP|nr:Cadherin-related tumor suppressor [Frankliniella fusca]